MRWCLWFAIDRIQAGLIIGNIAGVGEFVVDKGATDRQAHLREGLLALAVSEAFLKAAFVYGNTSC